MPTPTTQRRQAGEQGGGSGLVLSILPSQQHHARLVATGRTLANNATRKPAADMGSEAAKAEAYGVLAEIAIVAALERRGLRPSYVLLADRPVSAPDVILEGVHFDVKAVLPDKHYVCINAASHDSATKRPDFYLVGVFTSADTMRVLRPVPAALVDAWDRRSGRSDYYSTHIDTLPTLNDWHELTR